MTVPHTLGRDPTLIGRVRHVMGATVTVELVSDVAGGSPLFQGRVYRIGQVGSLVTIPQGPLRVIGAVSMIGITELVEPLPPGRANPQGDRWLTVQLLGELDAMGRFQRGVSVFPSLDDEVHFATSEELTAIYPGEVQGYVEIGRLSATRSDVFRLNLAKLVMRHTAVVGSTGSGKSSTVSRIVQSVLRAGYGRANIVVIDPHGEYAAGLGADATVMSIDGTGERALDVPYWGLGVEDLIRAYLGTRTTPNPILKSKVEELVLRFRREWLSESRWPTPKPDDITADTPVPYDLRRVWYELDFQNRAIARGNKNSGNYAIVDAGDADQLQGASFEQYAPGGPFQGPSFGQYRPLPDRMLLRLRDPRYQFLSRSFPLPTAPDPLPGILSRWLGGTKPVSVLDFSSAPSDPADVAIGAVLSILFDVVSSCPAGEGIGRHRPVWIVLEEAHRFLGEKVGGAAGAAREAAERIAREGRKYGMGLMLVSQRPAELSDTVLSQCGTILSMRLTNPSDQGKVKSALPDTVANLADALPALRTGEALVTGEATTLPARVMIDRPSPEPSASDPTVDAWRGEEAMNDVESAVRRWRDPNAGGAG